VAALEKAVKEGKEAEEDENKMKIE